MAFELLSPNRVCRLFSRALRRPVRYIHNPTIDIETSVPDGYRAQLNALEVLFGEYNAPYFGADMENGVLKEPNNSNGGKGDGSGAGSGEGTVVEEARALWGGWRGIEEYAREVFVCGQKRLSGFPYQVFANEIISLWRKLRTGKHG